LKAEMCFMQSFVVVEMYKFGEGGFFDTSAPLSNERLQDRLMM